MPKLKLGQSFNWDQPKHLHQETCGARLDVVSLWLDSIEKFSSEKSQLNSESTNVVKMRAIFKNELVRMDIYVIMVKDSTHTTFNTHFYNSKTLQNKNKRQY
ncbi:hypothetical protein BpHYR1_028041 [Brachionus plicatilis]|uniref:Uncharacterized protein n=1 Tax=Brachionus plicatilis TaxID=10195 RepID=A0A3M7Q6P9_BRAPC|nr:hypothetical protein BpHYR1_028041 [Brachionus plicatilis]